MYHARIGCDFFQSREESRSRAVDRFQEVSKGGGQITQHFIYIHCRTYKFQWKFFIINIQILLQIQFLNDLYRLSLFRLMLWYADISK